MAKFLHKALNIAIIIIFSLLIINKIVYYLSRVYDIGSGRCKTFIIFDICTSG
jgi:hypothetical protein